MVRVDGNGGGESLIRARGLDKSYVRGGEEIHVLQGLNLDVGAGEFIAFMGPSGSGKTTLLNLLGGLDVPSSGTVSVAGDEITSMSRRRLTAWRARHVGFVFQAYNLIPVLTAYRNVELPLLLTPLSKAERRSHVEAALRIVGLQERMQHFPRQLSGGQEQRVAIARAIVADPTFLLCDEPTGDLDRKSADEILDLLVAARLGARQDDPDGDPRPARRRARERALAPREGRAGRGRAGPGAGELVKYLPLLFANLKRKKIRTTLTIGSFAVAMFLFGLLAAVRAGFRQGIDVAGADRAGGDRTHRPDPAAAAALHGPHPQAARREGRRPRHLVRRRLPGPEELLRAVRDRARGLAADVPRVQGARRPVEGLPGRPPGHRDRRRSSRRASAGRSATTSR